MRISNSIAINNNPASALGGIENLLSVELDGVDEYVTTDANYVGLDGATKATFSFWLKMDTLASTTNGVFQCGTVFGMWVRNTGYLRWYMTGTSYYADSTASKIVAGQWHHVMICIDLPSTDEPAIFVDGVEVSGTDNLSTRPAFANSSAKLLLGYEASAIDEFMKGHFKDFAIWKNTDLRAEIADYYNSGVPTHLVNDHTTSPTNWWRLGDGGDTITSFSDMMGVNNASGVNLEAEDIVEDSP